MECVMLCHKYYNETITARCGISLIYHTLECYITHIPWRNALILILSVKINGSFNNRTVLRCFSNRAVSFVPFVIPTLTIKHRTTKTVVKSKLPNVGQLSLHVSRIIIKLGDH